MANILEILRGLVPQAADELMDELVARSAQLDEEGIDSRADLAAVVAEIKAETAGELKPQGERAAGEKVEVQEAAPAPVPAEEEAESELSLQRLADDVAGIVVRLDEVEGRLEDLQMAFDGLAARLPNEQELSGTIANTLRSELGQELATAVKSLRGLRQALYLPSRERAEAAEAEGEEEPDTEAALAIKSGLNAAQNVDPMSILYL